MVSISSVYLLTMAKAHARRRTQTHAHAPTHAHKVRVYFRELLIKTNQHRSVTRKLRNTTSKILLVYTIKTHTHTHTHTNARTCIPTPVLWRPFGFHLSIKALMSYIPDVDTCKDYLRRIKQHRTSFTVDSFSQKMF